MNSLPPCVIHEDEHLLVVNKPPGWNTHSPSPYAGEGIYEWFKHREPRWANLAIIHRLDKETSGVLVFGKTPLANKSLTQQFSERAVHKSYVLLTDRKPPRLPLIVRSMIVRSGDRYISKNGDNAETEFQAGGARSLLAAAHPQTRNLEFNEILALPLTGRTHQIRVHAATSGFPILGDILYGGSSWQRVCLHAWELRLRHPETARELVFQATESFDADSSMALRQAVIDLGNTTAFRKIHGAADDTPGTYVDHLGQFRLTQSESSTHVAVATDESHGHYHKRLNRHIRTQSGVETSPQLIAGAAAPERFTVLECGMSFELSFKEGYSVGLFLDQRDNRRRLLVNHVGAKFPLFENGMAGKEVLNTFAYTCAFSVCAAKAGAKTTSLDLSKKYLDWGRRNFELNGLDPAQHDFIYGDCFDWMKRLAKKDRRFDLILLDPPTFSQSKQSGVWRAEKDYGKLVSQALALL